MLTMVAVGVGAVSACSDAPHSVVHSESPTGRYEVQLSGQFDDPATFGAQHRVYVTVQRGKLRVVERRELHYAGFLDNGFRGSFKSPKWIAENVVWFETDRGAPTDIRDELWIMNQLPRPVQFLQVDARDTFLILDLEPGATLRLDTTAFRPAGDNSWLSVAGIAGGEELAEAHASFTLLGARSTRGRYDIVISLGGAIIHHRLPL